MTDLDGYYISAVDQLIKGGFEFIEQFAYDHPQEFTNISWRGRLRTCNGVGSGQLSASQLAQFDDEVDKMIAELVGEDREKVFTLPHRVFAILARNPMQTAV
eukprot:TRINITY_DN1529_c0_g1_i2.p8 TRINITY_DN1529_c0_g1~~TRINITY_DN1529_c0_g1_i2.p8  ORF type:complete len:102 (-),score=29.74 TRINITY_DN1529_c0_g1_i2:2572-2877(-)